MIGSGMPISQSSSPRPMTCTPKSRSQPNATTILELNRSACGQPRLFDHSPGFLDQVLAVFSAPVRNRFDKRRVVASGRRRTPQPPAPLLSSFKSPALVGNGLCYKVGDAKAANKNYESSGRYLPRPQ